LEHWNTTKGSTMQQPYAHVNKVDEQSRPSGGKFLATGITIEWQDGPLGRDGERIEPNGAFVETVLVAALQRLQFYNETEFRCRENSLAITHIEEALHWLDARTRAREARGVEGTHTV
jgi:hypothetical protein